MYCPSEVLTKDKVLRRVRVFLISYSFESVMFNFLANVNYHATALMAL